MAAGIRSKKGGMANKGGTGGVSKAGKNDGARKGLCRISHLSKKRIPITVEREKEGEKAEPQGEHLEGGERKNYRRALEAASCREKSEGGE